MKVAILHSWFLMKGGGERVVDVIAEMFPQADIFTLFADSAMLSPVLRKRRVYPSFLNAVPQSSRFHRHLLPFYPMAVESFDLREYDLVLSSCGPAMMGCTIRQDAVHICYCHTPQRSWWDLYSEHQAQLPTFLRRLFVAAASHVRTWEFSSMQRVDHVLANSNYIADRISKYFRRESTVIYPPVATEVGPPGEGSDDYYLTVGRIEKQKKLDILVNACNEAGRKLIIAGQGKEQEYLKSLAGPTIKFMGYVPDPEIANLYRNCRAFLFAADEDFGIAPVEAQAFGRPVIAYGHGGSLETVRVGDSDGRPDTGVFFSEQTPSSLIDAITRFERMESFFSPRAIQEHARKFDTANFVSNLRGFIDRSLDKNFKTSNKPCK